MAVMQIHATRGCDEIICLDISATAEGRGPDLGLIEELAEACFSPIAVGGGVSTVQDARNLLKAGADKIVIGSGHNEVPNLVRDIAGHFGSQSVVVAIDHKDGRYWTRCGTHDTGLSVLDAALGAESCGAGEILLTSIERDGTMCGYDLETIRSIANLLPIQVIAAGGCSGYEDMHRAIQVGADAIAAGAIFQFCDYTPAGAAEYLSNCGVEVRTCRK